MKRLMTILLILTLLIPTGFAASNAFQDDYEGIDRAAKSVLMLLVYTSGENEYDSTGSGFVAFDNQTLITNYHVVEDGDLVLAESDDGESFFLDQVIVADKEKDLAILRFKAPTKLSPLPLFEGDRLLRGQPVVAIGSPEGYKNTVSKGDISSFSTEDDVRFIHFTAPISHGSSGGALFNNEGEVIGVTSSSLFGSSQNMNFAIDIQEAIALYNSAKGREPTALSALGLERERETGKGSTEGSDEKPIDIKNLSVNQVGPGQVEVSWESEATPENWYVGYELSANNFYSFQDTQEKTMVIDNLVPGQEYSFYVSDQSDNLDRMENPPKIKLDEAKELNMRGNLLLDSGLYYTDKEQWLDIPLKPGLSQITTGQLYRAMADMKLSYIYRMKLEASQTPSEGPCLYVLYLPSGKIYMQEHIYEYDAIRASNLRSADLKDMLVDMLEYDKTFELGRWTAAVYHDSALLARTEFEVVEDSAGENERESGQGAEKGISISAIKGNAYLNWAGLEQADSYDIYRANTLDGHYFFVESTTQNHYLDEKVFSNRSYFYQLSYVNEKGETITTDKVSILIPPKSEWQKAEEESIINEVPGMPLEVGEEAYVGTVLNPYLDPDITNISEDKTVIAFTLAYFTTDNNFRVLNFADSDKSITYFTFDKTIGPGETQSPGKVSMKSYGPEVKSLFVAISSVTLEDGTVIKVPEEDLHFLSWSLD